MHSWIDAEFGGHPIADDRTRPLRLPTSLPKVSGPSKHPRFILYIWVTQCTCCWNIWECCMLFFFFRYTGFLQRCVCFCLGTVCPCLLALSVRFSLCPFLFFLFCSACPSRASRLICLCFRLNERSVEAGWRINRRICNKQSQLALPLMLSLRLVLFLPRSTPQEGEKRDVLLFTGLFLSVE